MLLIFTGFVKPGEAWAKLGTIPDRTKIASSTNANTFTHYSRIANIIWYHRIIPDLIYPQ